VPSDDDDRTVTAPSPDRIEALAAEFDLTLTGAELATFAAAAEEMAALRRLEGMAAPKPTVRYPERDTGGRVPEGEDPLNAWVSACEVRGADDGPLAGYEVGLKDSVALAGVEMTMGSTLMEGHVPEYDATVVTRLLDAGATITGKLNMEAMAASASGELSDHGACLNPRSADHLAGGSSSGSAAAVVAGDVDVAIGTDQAGSIRVPAAWSGCVGLKPTHTLVPYTGIGALGHTFDHAGPMTTTVADAAAVLAAIAGKDPLDPRQGAVPTEDYPAAVDDSPDPGELSVGVVEEGFGRAESEPAVDATVEAALDALADAGATVETVSIPWHLDAEPVYLGFYLQETAALLLSGGQGYFGKGFYDGRFAAAWNTARRESAEALPGVQKLELVMARYLDEEYGTAVHATAQNLRRPLAAAYDDALAEYDVLAMPTTPTTAHEVLEERSFAEGFDRSLDMLGNTEPFDATGHPAVSVPCGAVDGLPVGLQLVGERFADAAVLRAAKAFEAHVGWAL